MIRTLLPTLLTLGLIGAADSDDKALPADAQAALARAEKAEAAVQAKANIEVSKIRRELVASLTKSLEASMKKADLDTAIHIKKKIEGIRIPDDPLTPTPSQALQQQQQKRIDPQRLQNITPQLWDQAPGKLYIIANSESDPIVVAEGEEIILLPSPTDTWNAGPGYPMVTYRGSNGVGYGGSNFMTLICVSTSPQGVQSAMTVSPTVPLRGPTTVVLRPNDGDLSDNSGSIRVKVITQRSP